MQKSAIVQRFFLVVFILLSGCGSSPDIQVNELSSSTTSYDETIHINNCGGKADSEQTASRSFATNIEGGIEVGVQQVVEGVISAKYSQYRNISKSQRLIAPAGTNMEFVLRWSEEVRAGNVTVNGATGTYKASIPISVEQVSSQDLGCSGISALPTVTYPTQASPTQSSSSSTASLVNRISLGSNVSLAPLVNDIVQNPSQVSQTQLENAVRRIQAEADRLHSGRFESNSVDIPQDNWWLIWCSNVPSKYYNSLPTGWSYLFEQQLPTFGQLYVVSPTAESRHLDSCNSPKGWWGVVIYQ